MTEDHTTRTRRTASMRKLLYTPLAVGILAGAVCAGTGLGTAAPATAPDAVAASTSTPDAATASTTRVIDRNWWSLSNDTGKPIYGEFNYQVGTQRSNLILDKDLQLQQGGREGRPWLHSSGFQSEYWTGHICYDHKWWNIPPTEFYTNDGSFSCGTTRTAA
ncbi:hypothetical protein [Rhodococcus jostii]|uniref:hypothetical protein n=1 Tax=Rhodococcus jostii TaxID=132919 RepID=UPI00363BA897